MQLTTHVLPQQCQDAALPRPYPAMSPVLAQRFVVDDQLSDLI